MEYQEIEKAKGEQLEKELEDQDVKEAIGEEVEHSLGGIEVDSGDLDHKEDEKT